MLNKMIINNKILLLAISLSLVLTSIGVILYVTDHDAFTLLTLGPNLFILSGGYLLLKNGYFIKTSEFRITRLGISLILVGVLLKIMHWPFAAEILAIGFISFPCIYVFYLIKNHRIHIITLLKLLFITTISLSAYVKIIHFPYSEEIILIGITTLLILLIDFIKNKRSAETKY